MQKSYVTPASVLLQLSMCTQLLAASPYGAPGAPGNYNPADDIDYSDYDF